VAITVRVIEELVLYISRPHDICGATLLASKDVKINHHNAKDK